MTIKEMTDVVITTFDADGGFYVDIVEKSDEYEAWIYRSDCGIKELMFGVNRNNIKDIPFLIMVENNIAEYKVSYHNHVELTKYDKLCETERKLLEMKENGWEIPKMVACVYDLFQNYYINEYEEDTLYSIADPAEEYNNCSDYWRDMDYENPLLKIWK